jgi:multicomponent Na+:H+ antiporter subunit D
VVALTRDNLKARLAYSTVSQLAYIVLGAALATGSSVVGGGMHIAMHACAKITLFFCAGAIDVATHRKNVSQLDGIGYRMPFTMTAFALGSLSIIGVPPFGGVWSKWYLVLGAADAHQTVFMAVLLLSSLLSIGYLMPIVVRAFFVAPPEDERGLREAPLLCVVPLCLTAIGGVVLFFLAPLLEAFLRPLAGG